MNGLGGATKPATELAKNTVEQIAVGPSTLNTARTTAKGKRNQPLWRLIPTPFQRQKSRPSIRRARVIQIRQKLDAQRNLLVDGLAVSSTGISIYERLIKNSVVRCATTLYALLVPELNATTRLVVRSEESPPPTA